MNAHAFRHFSIRPAHQVVGEIVVCRTVCIGSSLHYKTCVLTL